MSKVTSKATHWIRQHGYNEENLPGDEYGQMLQAYEAGYREREKEMKDEMKDRISMALKDPILQQGFEIICKENAELKEEIKNNEDLATVAYMQAAEQYKPKWHKVADGDLPKKVDDYVTNIGILTYDNYGNGIYKWHTPFCEACDYGEEVGDNEVIAWCEIPKYTED